MGEEKKTNLKVNFFFLKDKTFYNCESQTPSRPKKVRLVFVNGLSFKSVRFSS